MDNPYIDVWDKVEDQEKDLVQAAHNGTLFAPSWEELGYRHATTCRHLLRQARKLGPTVEGRKVFEKAVFHRNMAEKCFTKRDEMIRAVRGM